MMFSVSLNMIFGLLPAWIASRIMSVDPHRL
jgi:hypothetical protein